MVPLGSFFLCYMVVYFMPHVVRVILPLDDVLGVFLLIFIMRLFCYKRIREGVNLEPTSILYLNLAWDSKEPITRLF